MVKVSKKKGWKIFVGIFLSVLLFVGSGVPVFAYNVFGYTLNGGVGNYGFDTRNYWIDSSASEYTSLINNAVSSWVETTARLNITTPISLASTTTKSSSYFDVYMYELPGASNGIAATFFYVKNVGCINPDLSTGPNQNYSWTEIVLNSSTFPNLQASIVLTATEKQQGTIAHEFGHAMGLAHNSNVSSIMCQLQGGRRVYMPMVDDANGINYLYAN